MSNQLKFRNFLDILRGDRGLIKGWFPIEEEIAVYKDDEPSMEFIKKIGILYDCHLLYFNDEDGKFLKLLDEELLKSNT